MARVFKEKAYNAKRDEIIAYAMSLVYRKGYEQMTIQDILDGLSISRGALYHYFDSKASLLEAMITHSAKAGVDALLPILNDPHLSALEKLKGYFRISAGWKIDQKELIISLMRNWYTDENLVVRQKMTSESLKVTAQLIEPIIRQGVDEGVFSTGYPEEVAVIFVGISLSLTDRMVELILMPHPDQTTLQKSQDLLGACFESMERVLGATPGTIRPVELDVFKEWWDLPENETRP